MRRILLYFTATAMVVAASYAIRSEATQPLITSTTSSAPQPVVDVPQPAAPATNPSLVISGEVEVPAELDRLIGVFERRTANSVDPLDFRTLGSHLTTRASFTGSIADYRGAVAAYKTAYESSPTDLAVLVGYASAATKVHDFQTAQEISAATLALDPTDTGALAVAADAATELGDLESATEYLNRLEAAAPGHPAALARLANISHLTGDQKGAIALATNAEELARAGGYDGRALAFYPLLRTDLLLDAGRYEEALEAVEDALAIEPHYPVSHASKARVLAHLGDTEKALELYLHALTLQADPGWDASVGELLTVLDRPVEADAYFARAIAELKEGDETIFGRSLAGLYADLDIEPEAALRIAQEDLERRQDIHAYDTLAWALYRNGMFTEARAASDVAVSTGAMDAGLLYHSAVIAAAIGDVDRAISELTQLIDTNPGFNPLQGRHAAELLTSLTG